MRVSFSMAWSKTCSSLRIICEKHFLHLRGIVYPRWIKRNNKIPDKIRDSFEEGKDYLKSRWEIETYAYSFSKQIESPTCCRLKTGMDLNLHVQQCPFKRVRELKEKFKIY